jgi:hypothetical protein
VEISVQGVNSAQVVITDMRPRVLARRAPIKGTVVSRGCGDEGAFRLLSVDLDKNPPSAVPESNGDQSPPTTAPWQTKPIRFPYRVSLSDAETFVIDVSSKKYDTDWVVDLSWSSSGKTGTLVVDNNGKPFRTSSTVNAQDCQVAGKDLVCS